VLVEMVQFCWIFYWNRMFLLCTTISIDRWLLQNCWQPKFIHVMLKMSESGVQNFGKVGVGKFWKGWGQKFWKLGVRVGHFTSDSANLVPTENKPRLHPVQFIHGKWSVGAKQSKKSWYWSRKDDTRKDDRSTWYCKSNM